MDLKLTHWSNEQYENFINTLKQNGDNKFIEFNKKLIFTKYEFIGIKTSILRNYAKESAKGNPYNFLALCKKDYYEEVLLRGLIIGYLKTDFENLIPLVESYIDDIDNWALCDLFCGSLKIAKKLKKEFWCYIKNCVKLPNPYKVRFSIVMMLDYYLEPDYIDEVLDMIDNISLDDYYVKMAKAWLVSISYVKLRDRTLAYLKNSCLDDWTYNRALQKAIESKRVGIEEKEMLRRLKR